MGVRFDGGCGGCGGSICRGKHENTCKQRNHCLQVFGWVGVKDE